ncbi:MAG: hypothetical protein AAF704_16425 [Cyanobacteria bacterium P01_D01_bin.123]
MQLELDLWNDLDKAAVSPVELDLNALLDKLDQMVASLEGDRKLALAGETLDQLAGVWQIRTEEMLLDWRDRFEGARLADDWLGALYQPPDSFNVAEFEIPLLGVRKPRTRLPIDSETLVEEVDKDTLLAWADEREREISTMEEVVQLAHEESIQEWAEAIARVLEHHKGEATLQTLCKESRVGEDKRSLVWVEAILGCLLSHEPGFRLLRAEEFYGRSDRVWIQPLNA